MIWCVRCGDRAVGNRVCPRMARAQNISSLRPALSGSDPASHGSDPRPEYPKKWARTETRIWPKTHSARYVWLRGWHSGRQTRGQTQLLMALTPFEAAAMKRSVEGRANLTNIIKQRQPTNLHISLLRCLQRRSLLLHTTDRFCKIKIS